MIFDQKRLRTLAGCAQGGADSGRTTADNKHVRLGEQGTPMSR